MQRQIILMFAVTADKGVVLPVVLEFPKCLIDTLHSTVLFIVFKCLFLYFPIKQ